MAKKKPANGNVSEMIRKTWDQDQSQKPAAIVEALKAKGIAANPGTVATTISAYRKKLGMAPLRGKRKGRRGRGANKGQRTGNGLIQTGTSVDSSRSISSVLEALKLVTKAKELVGMDGLREIVKAI
jgi:hypothetical protein